MRNFKIAIIIVLSIAVTGCGKNIEIQKNASASSNTALANIDPSPVITPVPTIDPEIQQAAEAKLKTEADAQAKLEAENKAKKEAEKIVTAAVYEKQIEEQNKVTFSKHKAEVLGNFPEVSDIGVIGDLVAMVYLRVDSTDIIGGNGYSHQANGIYHFFRVDLLNNGKKSIVVDSSMFTLVAPDGTTYDSDPTAALYSRMNNSLFLEKLNPGSEIHGYVVFDIPPDVKKSNLVLRVTSGKDHMDLNLTR
jgi:hypothetical protein